VARQAQRLLLRQGLAATDGLPGTLIAYTTGDAAAFAALAARLLGRPIAVRGLRWRDGLLEPVASSAAATAGPDHTV
jgi:hypothetical protein